MKIGFVLEGGAMRGLYTAGVLDIFMDHEIPVDGMIGVSAGTLFGVNYPSRQRGRALRYNLEHAKKSQYMGIRSLITTGNIINKDYAYYKVPMELDVFDDEAFQKSGIDFYATVTNVETGEAEYIKLDSVFRQMEVIRATSAMPFLSEMIEWDGQKYLDGCIADSVPLQKCMEMGYDKIVVILTRPAGYRKSASNGKMAKRYYKDYPNLVEGICNRHLEYNSTLDLLEELEEQGKIFVIRPSQELYIHRIERNAKRLTAVYDQGIKDAQDQMETLQKYLER
ncbi:MAG: patatin family protein [Agathobacter sp.]|nr:patatin family protein [Agathobacter sp.]